MPVPTQQTIATWGAGGTWSLWRSVGQATPVERPSDALAGRYELQDWLGGGGNGQVWRALDRLTGQHVAVKLVRALSAADLQQARREIVALRWARLPGVVGLRDDGRVGDDWFIVMDHVDGLPFPGRQGVLSWEELAPVALRLLAVLAGLHAAGVVHRDLKPPNVAVVPARGDVVLLDLGLATGRAVTDVAGMGRFAGTPAYAAPEQIEGGAFDARTDLYAVGVMLFGALTGRMPQVDTDLRRLLRRRLDEPAPPVGSLAEVPPPVAEVIDAMLARRPQDRPESAWAVLAALGGAPPAPITGELELPAHRCDAAALRLLFHGPDHLLHLREDAAAVLWARTGGQPAAVREELGAWLRAGLGHWDQGAVRVNRGIIGRLQAGEGLVEGDDADSDVLAVLGLVFPHGTAERVGRVLGRDVSGEVEQLLAQGRAWSLGDTIGARPRRKVDGLDEAAVLRKVAMMLPRNERGRVELLGRAGAAAGELRLALAPVLASPDLAPEHALALIELAVVAARAEAERQVEVGLLHQWAAFALMLEAAAPVERALYEVQRFEGPAGVLENLEALLRAARAAYGGSPAQARALVEVVAPFGVDELERWRCALAVHAVRIDGPEVVERELERLEAWAQGNVEREARVLGWWGNLRYRQLRFEESARLHEQAAAGKQRTVGWLTSLRNAAAAWMEAGDFARAEELAEQMVEAAAKARMARKEASSMWCLRASQTRRGRPPAPSPELVEAGFMVDRQVGAQLALAECIAALVHRDHPLAAALAARAEDAFHAGSQAEGAALSRLVLLLAGGPDARPDLLAWLDGVRAPGIRLQVLGLGGQFLGDPSLVDQARAILATFDEPDRPLELATARQCVERSPYGPEER